jgi:ribonuclease P protein component
MAGDDNFRFPSTMRLKKKTEFTHVFREGVTWKGSYFSLHLLLRTGGVLPRKKDGALLQEEGPRLGMVVTRKVGSAVERNRIKRKIREAFRKTAHRLPAVDLVIRPNAACKEAPEEEISQCLERAVKMALESVKERT